MPISFLDLVPKPPTAAVTIDTMQGPTELELTGVSLRMLADIGKRFPAFARVLEGGPGSIMDDPDALAALVAAALGHPGDARIEAHVEAFPAAAVIQLALAAARLTFPQADVSPLPQAGALDAAAAAVVDGLDRTSQLRLSN